MFLSTQSLTFKYEKYPQITINKGVETKKTFHKNFKKLRFLHTKPTEITEKLNYTRIIWFKNSKKRTCS